ncbi:CotH kinase family protein [Cystobacter ferrugineus]|uniref:Inner spore coat protein H n=1 Tax=Cystobacter ferrugineus TaxID=83449 RepID=A0A1L9BAL4_9BACT|nr:CotH kinase family protein [Cystobacter ferrugineus]OJH39304.1 Inner spore coat protein H [Cystobacter ferrugineus]
MKIARLLCLVTLSVSSACGPGKEPPTAVSDHPSLQVPTPGNPPPGEQPPSPPATGGPPTESPPSTDKPPPAPDEQRPFVLPAVQRSVQAYEILFPPGVMEMFYKDKNTPEQDAIFRYEGVDYPVKVRLRGASARDFPKKSWNVSFEKDSPFEGRTSLNLVAGYSDASMLAEKIAFDLLAAMRVPAAKVKFVRLSLNGKPEGVFLDIEQINKPFLRAHDFRDTDASIYRAGWKDTEFKLRSWKVPYQGDWQKKTNEKKEGHEALDEVLAVINRTPEPELPEALARAMDLEGYLRSMVMDALMANNYIEDSESYFIHDHVTKRWVYVAWDLNNVDARWWYQMARGPDLVPIYAQPLYSFTLGNPEVANRYRDRKGIHPGYLPVFSNLATRIVMNPELRARLEAHLDKAMRELFTMEVMGPYIDQLHAVIAPYMAEDPYMDHAKFEEGDEFIKEFVRLRRAFVLEELERIKAHQPGVVLEALDAKAGWVELRNRGTTPVNLGGRVLTTNLRRNIPALLQAEPTAAPREQAGKRVGTVLAARTLAPGARVRLTAAELGLTFTPEGEIGLFDGQSVSGLKDALFYGKLPNGQHYERAEDGTWRTR